MVRLVVGLVHIARKAVASGHKLLVFCEIFAAHDRVTAQMHVLFAVHRLGGPGRPIRAGLVVDGGDKLPGIFHFEGRIVHVADGRHDLAHALLDLLRHRRIVAAAVAFDGHVGGDGVGRAVRDEFRAADHGRPQRVYVPGHDGLQRHNDLRADHDGILRLMRAAGVTPQPMDADNKVVLRCHAGANCDLHRSFRIVGKIVLAVDLLDAVALHQAVRDHGIRTPARLFRRLEYQHDGAMEGFFLRDKFCGAQQRRRMTVVTAGMHALLGLRPIGHIAGLHDLVAVHVGPEAQHQTFAVLQNADDACLSNVFFHFVAEFS